MTMGHNRDWFLNTLLLKNQAHSVEESLEARIGWALVVDKLYFYSLHGSDCKYGFAHSSSQSTQHSPSRTQVAFLIYRSFLESFKGSKPVNRTSIKLKTKTFKLIL